MEVTIVKSSSEKARGKGNGNGSNRGLPIHYNSKSLERPKGAKGSHEASSSGGTAAVVQSLSGKSNSTGLHEADNDTDSVGTCDSDEGMLDQAYRRPQAMSSDPFYRQSGAQPRQRSATASGAMVIPHPRIQIAMDDFSLNRNSPFAESYRFAVEHNALSRTGSADNPTRRTQQCKAAVDEILTTERTYVLRLNDVLKGYRDPLNVRMHELPISVEDAKVLFAEIREIRDFNRGLLEAIERCGYDMKKLGECFLKTWSKEEGCQLYSKYCTKYPVAVEVYTKCVENATMLEFFKKCQREIRHALPLGSDLLEPVQRVLRYHILLQKIKLNLHVGEDGYEEIKAAHETMTGVAEQINEMKRKHESAVHVHEVQSQLQGWAGNDLTTYGELTLEDAFKYYSGRASNIPFRGTEDRHVFLFKRLILLTKKREEAYKYKGHIEWTDLQLIETLERHPNSFQVKQLSTGTVHTFHPRSEVVKQLWVKAIKKMIVESIPEISHRISPNLKALLLKGARKSDMTPENISGDFRHKSTSMHGLNEISKENSPRLSGSRLTLSATASSQRTMNLSNQGPVSADDFNRLPNRRSSSTERLHFSKEYDGRTKAADNGIVLEAVKGPERGHGKMTHSRSAGISGSSRAEHHSQLSRNVSDGQIVEKSRSPTDKDSVYSSDSIGSLDQSEMSDLDQGRTRGSSPSTDLPASDSPAHDGLSSGSRTRSSGRRKKARPISFAESDNIPEDDILPRELSPASQTFRKSESPSAELPATLEHGSVSQSSLFPESIFASLESQWGDSLLTQIMQKSDATTTQSHTEASQLPPHSGQSRTTAMPSTMPPTGPPPGIITRGQYTAVPQAKLSRRQSNELGSELQEDRYCQLKGSFARRQTLDEDLETTYFDDHDLSLPPPDDGIEEPLQAVVSESSFPILTPPDTFKSTSHVNLQTTSMSPTTSENFYTPVASPDPSIGPTTHSDVLPSEVEGINLGTTTDNGTGTSAEPPAPTPDVSIPVSNVPDSSDSVAASDQGASIGVSPSPTGSAESELIARRSISLSQSTPVTRRLIPIEKGDKRRPLSLCSVDSQSSDGSPRGLRRRILVSMVKSDSANVLQPADACVDTRSAMLSRSGGESKSPSGPTASVLDTDTSSDAESRKDSVYSLQSAEINFDAETPVNADTQKMSIDEILPILDIAAGKIMEENNSLPSTNSSTSVPSIVVDTVCADVKKHSKMGSARMSPLRRHTTPDMAAALEAESNASKTKEKSPSTKVKKIARDYSRRIREGKTRFTRFQSFTSPSGYTALDSPDFPRKSAVKSELSGIVHTFSSEPGSTPKPPRPPWLEEAKRVRDLRKFQASPSASSLDSGGSHSVTTPTDSVGSDWVVPEETMTRSKLSLDSASPHVTALPVPDDKQTDVQIRPRFSASPLEPPVGDLFAMRTLSKSTDAIPRSLSTSDVKNTKVLRRPNRSPSFNRASIAGDMVTPREESRPRLVERDLEDIQHRGKIRGFVRSLVDRFSGRNH